MRIFTRTELETKLREGGLFVAGHHRAHALHSPYWWLKCAVGVHNDDHPLASAYHKLLVWDIMRKPAVTQSADQVLNPLIGKSLVVYAAKPAVVAARPRPGCSGEGACGSLTVCGPRELAVQPAAVADSCPSWHPHRGPADSHRACDRGWTAG